ncbi:MAG: zinc transporter ZupT [Candidatus Woesearchaeota archaeon]
MIDHYLFLPLVITLVAAISTGIGSLIPIFFKNFNRKILIFSLGLAAGVMIFISFGELLPEAVEDIGMTKAFVAFFIGVGFMMLLDFLIPHKYIEEEHFKKDNENKKIKRAGLLVALGVAIHNLPEGIAVFMSSVIDIELGIALAVAIAVHNIPEGIAISAPIYYSTKSRAKAFWYSFLSGMAQPLGAVIAAIFFINFMTPVILAYTLAFVAGIMIFISFDEILPITFKDSGEEHLSITGLFIGMLIMAITLIFI